MHFPLHRPVPPVPSRRPVWLRGTSARRFGRDTAEFEADLRAALESERRELQREVDRLLSDGALVVARGAVDSGVRVAGERDIRRHERLPLVVRPPATIRVLGPRALTDVVLDGLLRRAMRRLPPDRLAVDERRIDSGRLVTVRSRSRALWLLASCRAEGAPVVGALTELWFAPDGSAQLRSASHTGDRWIPVEPALD
ncbi:hypothetical protein [Frondihabitans peucedani]|uniref:Uncharacterized protein n=1 Tax=Frondihabitans peucedani TaxID=598626 RepID=A0ABP8DYH3_9MICO